MSWLERQRAELAAERILDAAAELFSREGVDGPGMEDVARAAGCSRTTLYRYFENRTALHHAFAVREARSIMRTVVEQTAHLADPRVRGVESIVAAVAAVRARPYLQAWYAGGETRVLHGILQESPVIASFAGEHLRPAAGEPDRDLARWVLRCIMSLLVTPGTNEDEERRLVDRFLGPHLDQALARSG